MERTAGCAPLGRALAAEDQCVTHVLALGSMGDWIQIQPFFSAAWKSSSPWHSSPFLHVKFRVKLLL